MKASAEVCRGCGQPLTPTAAGGLCFRCLAQLGTAQAVGNSGGLADSIRSDDPPSERQGQNRTFGDYELLEEIARGGMGVVYRARQVSLDRQVAVKMILYSEFAGSANWRRFQAEAQSAAKLRHPNIIAVHEIGMEGGQPFFSMEYVAGQSLAELVREQPLLSRRAARYLATVARAVHSAHQQQVLHRDLKPSNILIDSADEPRVTDFGLACRLGDDSGLTISGQPLGTPSYMPPEQVAVKRSSLGPACDVYSLGAILYHLLAGRPPFLGESLAKTFEQILHDQPPPLRLLNSAVPRDLETICLKCLKKDPNQRYASAEALAEELERFLQGEPVRARPATALEKTWRWCRRRPAIALSMLTVGLVGLSALLIVTAQWRRAERANAQSVKTAREAELQLAEGRLNQGQRLQGLATLARLAREFPNDRITINRLFAELNDMTFVLPVGPILHKDETIWSGDLSPDERRLVTTTDTAVAFLWEDVGDASREPRLAHRLVHPDRVYLARFSPDGHRVATACADRKVRFWDAKSGEALGQPLQHPEEIFTLCFSPDGDELATATVDGTVRLWRPNETAPHHVFPPEAKPPLEFRSWIERFRIHDRTVLGFSPDGQLLLSGVNGFSVRIWDRATGQLKATLGHKEFVLSAEFAPDGRRVVTASANRVARVWDLQSDSWTAREQSVPTPPIQVRFRPDGKCVATGFYNHTVSLWDPTTGEGLLPPLRHKSFAEDIDFSPDGRCLLVAVHDGSAHVWDTTSGRALTEPVRAAATLRSARFLSDGQRFYTRGTGGVRFWRIGSPAAHQASTVPGQYQIYSVHFLPGEQEIISVDAHNAVGIWERSTGRLLAQEASEPGRFFRNINVADPLSQDSVALALIWERQSAHRLGDFVRTNELLSSFAASPDGAHVAFGLLTGGARLVDLSATPPQVVELKNDNPFTSLEFTADSRRLVTGSYDSTARVWDSASGQPLSPLLRHAGAVAQVHISPSGRFLLTRGHFIAAMLWDLAKDPPVARLLQHESEAFDVRFDSTGRRVVTASADWTARLWDTETGAPVGYPLHHQADVRQAAFTPDGTRIVTSCGDGTLRVWDAATGLPLAVPLRTSDVLHSLELSHDGAGVVCGSLEGNVYRCDLTVAPLPAPDWLPDLADALTGCQEINGGVTRSLPPDSFNRLATRLQTLSDTNFYVHWVKERFLSFNHGR